MLGQRLVRAALGGVLLLVVSLFPAGYSAFAAQGYNEGCSVFMPCADGLSCHPFVQKCFNVPRRETEPCMAGFGCAPGLNCEAGSQVCRAPGKSGEACHLTRPCADGLNCQPGVQKCFSVPRAESEPCSAGYGCGPGLVCEAGAQVCRALGKSGDACHATRPCGAGLSCQPGVQKCFHSPRAETEPCSAGFGCSPGLSCTPGKQICERLAAKQCVTNLAAYSAKVEWWKPTDLKYVEKTRALTLTNDAAEPTQVDDNITVGFGSCNNSSEARTAVVRIKGAKIANGAIGLTIGAVLVVVEAAVIAGEAGIVAAVCVGTAGAGCGPAVLAGVALGVGTVGLASTALTSMALPDPQEIAYVGTPSKTQEVQFKGTIWEPFWTAGALRGGPEAHSVSTAADLTQACNTAIQDKVAWSRGGSKHWDASNLRDLCTGARTPSAIATCVTDGISAHNDWVRAVRECKGR